MSSSEFEVDLAVDPGCRQLVFACGWVLALCGAIVISSSNFPVGLRGILLAMWTFESLRELRNYASGLRQIRGFRLSASGRIRVLTATGNVMAVELETGTMVLRHFAWIRVRFADGRRHGELLAACRADSRSWHRLQLVFRLCREAFGHPG